jgi:elongation factor G
MQERDWAMPDDTHTPPLLVVEIAIEPRSRADHEKLGVALAQLAAEDPSFGSWTDRESGQTILKGPSESHLAAKIELLKRAHGINANVGAPQVAFRERPTRRAEAEFTHKKVTAGSGRFAAVKLVVEPNDPDMGFQFKIAGSALREEFVAGVRKGLESVLVSGVVAGFPVVDVRVELIEAKYHDTDSSALAFEIATRAAFREALQQTKPVLLEPIMSLEVVTPRAFAGIIIRDLNPRRAQMLAQQLRGDAVVISAMVPLMEMFGYADRLHVISEGRSAFTMQFDHYAPGPLPGNDPPFRPAMGMRA